MSGTFNKTKISSGETPEASDLGSTIYILHTVTDGVIFQTFIIKNVIAAMEMTFDTSTRAFNYAYMYLERFIAAPHKDFF
jgi:hypothetical protein